jgi:hypothetical protein
MKIVEIDDRAVGKDRLFLVHRANRVLDRAVPLFAEDIRRALRAIQPA